jgi:hypothetical protein
MPTRADPFALTESEWLSIAPLLGAVFVMTIASLALVAGLPVRGWPVLIVSTVLTSAAWAALARGRAGSVEQSTSRLVAWLAVVCAMGGYVTWLAWPSLYPRAEGPDLVHHLTLVHFIARYHALPTDPALGPYLGEMGGYPPGSHALAALAGEWLRSDAIRLVHPVMAIAVAVKAGLLFHVIVRLLPRDRGSVPLASAGTLLVLVPHAYLLRSVTHYGFYSQVVAETFAVAMLWTLVVWYQQPARRWLVLFAASGIGVALSWPVFVPPPALALLVLGWPRRAQGARRQLVDLGIGLGPIGLVVIAFAASRSESAGILASGGDVLAPWPTLFGWPLLVLMAAGIGLAVHRHREHRPLLVFSAACLAQVVGLVALQHLLRATNYYLGFKTVHLLVYPLVVFAAIGLALGWRGVLGLVPPVARRAVAHAAWALPIALVVLLGRTDLPKRPLDSPFTQQVHEAGTWAGLHAPANCVDYLVEHWLTAYWLHVDVLGNARASTRDHDPYDFHRAVGRWVGTDSMRYAIVGDWTIIPRDAREHMHVRARFDGAAVVERRDGRGSCRDRTPTVDEIARGVHGGKP